MYRAVASLILALGVLQGCSKEEPPVPEPESRPAKLLTVSVGNNEFSRTFPAQVEAGDKAVLAFRVPGQLQNIFITSGSDVKKGDTLAELNPDEYTLLKKRAQADFELSKVQYTRMEKLRKDRVVSEQDFDTAQANYNSAKASLNQASANLRYTKLIAPYDGTVSIVNAENYEYMAVSQPVMNIQTTDVLKVVFQLPSNLLSRFGHIGQAIKTSVVFDAHPDEEFLVAFQEIDTEADSRTASYKVTMVMESPGGANILPGMSGEMTVILPKSGATKVPASALFSEGEQQYLWRVTEEGLTEQVGVTLNEQGEVLTGLNDGDQIIVSGVSNIEAGIKVREWIKERGL